MKQKFTKKVSVGLLAMILCLSFNIKVSGQFAASDYSFTAVSGTYVPLTGGTAFTAVQADQVCPATTIPIGFTFNFSGTDYTTIRAGSNGYLTFSTGGANTSTNSLTNLNTIKPALMWLWDDLNGATTGVATYATTGTAPNRVFTFQFQNWRWFWSATGPNISCQVKLYETTNVIEYIYNQEANAGTPNSASIGICDGATTATYLSLNNSTATPTASSTTFTTNINARPASGQIYRFSPPPNCSTVTGWPASATTTVTPGTVCVSGNVTLNFNPATPLPAVLGLSYQWQSAPAAGGPWTTIGTSAGPTFTTTTNAPLFYRGQLMCNTNSVAMTASASAQVVINNPGTPVVTGATRCGPGTLTLNAVPPGGSNIVWYANATGGLPLATTNSYTTPYLPVTTTFYAAAASGTSAVTAQIGSGTASTSGSDAGPFNIWFRRSTMQFLYTGNEITAAGGGGGTINSLAFNCTALPTYNILNYTVKVKTVPSTMTALTWQSTGMTTVYNTASYMPAATGWQTLNFTTPISYAAGEGIVVELCWDQTQPSFSGSGGTHEYTNTTGRFLYSWTDGAGSSCGTTGTSTSSNLPNVRFGMVVGCEGARQPVTATITPGPAINIAKPAVVCSGEIATIAVTSAPMTNYTTYAWTANVADLYTNAAATTPYVSGSAPNVYFKSPVNGAHTYYLFSSGATPAACTHADTFSIWVQPDSVEIDATVDSICVSGTTTLSLVPSTGYAPNTIQWQESVNGTAYNNISGATGVTYTTPVLTTNRYYRVLTKSTNDTCEMPVKHIVVVNPQLLGTIDSFNCGPGTVTLGAITGGNGSAVWFDTPTGGSPVGVGSPFTTPFITASTDYYVSVASSSDVIGPKILGAGALTSGTQTYNPFCANWGGAKMQYLIRASELAALGIPAGATITSLGVDVVTGGATYPGFTISMKHTATTALTNTYETGTNVTFPATDVTPTSNALNNYLFGTPFIWDGGSNVLIQMCWSNGTNTSIGNTVKGDVTTFVATHRGQSDSQTPAGMCGIAAASTNTTYSNRPKFTFGYTSNCETPRQVVHANIYPKPAVDLGPDINMCVDPGSAIVLDAGYQPNTPAFLWDNNTTNQVRAVNASGTYNVKVTNQYNCVGSDTINVLLRKNPVVDLGNDTSVCNGVVLALNAGSGSIEYFWNTGQTGQIINVNTAGTYSVLVTNAEGCTVSDTIQVTMQGELPSVNGIQITNNGNRQFHFTAVNPQNVIGYDWDFGDGSLHSYEASPTHTYDSVGNYIVVLRLSSTCGFASDTVGAHIVGIRQLNVNNDELTVYPNPSNGQATILNKGDLKMEKIEVYNILGQVVYRSKADSKDKHVINLSNIASGIYTIEIYTDRGTVARKLEILK